MATTTEAKKLKYLVLIENLRRKILGGELKPGDRVPSLAEMQLQFQVSRGTVEKAYAFLEQEGLLVREQGSGTFVAHPAKQNGTKTIGLILHADPRDMATPYAMHLLAGIRKEAAERDLQIYWINPQDEKTLSREKMDAVLLYCNLTEALSIGIPAALPHALLLQHSPDFTCITADDFEGARLATQHLLDLGHRRIGCLTASASDSVSRQRVAGYRAALKNAGNPAEESSIRYLLGPSPLEFRKSGGEAMQSWLQEDWGTAGYTAIVAHNDEAAIGAIQVLKSAGVRVPEDVSVIGFDGTELCELCSPRLSTIKVPLREIGECAIKALSNQIQGGMTAENQEIILPVQLKVGDSTAPARI